MKELCSIQIFLFTFDLNYLLVFQISQYHIQSIFSIEVNNQVIAQILIKKQDISQLISEQFQQFRLRIFNFSGENITKMKWKPDTIEEFVQYKILHPQQSFQSLKNYQTEKKHNSNLDKLYKELSKYRSQQNHYKSELHKLNQIVLGQVVNNIEEAQTIDLKIQEFKGKIKQRNQAQINNQATKIKKQEIVSKYQNILREQSQIMQGDENQQKASINQMSENLLKFTITNNSQTTKNQISLIQEDIEKHKKAVSQRRCASERLKSISGRIENLSSSISQKSQLITKQKQRKFSNQQQQRQSQLKLFLKMKENLSNYHSDIIKQLKFNQILETEQTIQQYLESVKKELQQQQTGHQNVIFNPNIDMSFSKIKSNNFSETSNVRVISRTEQIQQIVLKMEKFLNQQRLINNIYPSEHEQISKNGSPSTDINETEQNIQKAQNSLLDQVIKTPQHKLCKQYIDRFLNENSPSELQQMSLQYAPKQFQAVISILSSNLLLLKEKSQVLLKQHTILVNKKQAGCVQKQKQLDKQINQLQNKINKTQLEIIKKGRMTF